MSAIGKTNTKSSVSHNYLCGSKLIYSNNSSLHSLKLSVACALVCLLFCYFFLAAAQYIQQRVWCSTNTFKQVRCFSLSFVSFAVCVAIRSFFFVRKCSILYCMRTVHEQSYVYRLLWAHIGSEQFKHMVFIRCLCVCVSACFDVLLLYIVMLDSNSRVGLVIIILCDWYSCKCERQREGERER